MKNNNFEYEVALSFAGEQRKYVEKVSQELNKLNVKHFYDMNEQIDLWGKNLTQYLDSIYFEKAMYFVPFISQEYIEKVWTKLEVNSALDRNMNDSRPNFQQYILPVRFDDTRVPGIVNTIAHIDARKVSPEELANMIYQKLHSSKKKIRNRKITEKIVYTDYNDEINSNMLNIIENAYITQTQSHAIVAYGEKGLGKKSCIQYFLHNKKNVIQIYPGIETQYQLEPIISSLNLEINNSFFDSDLRFIEQIKKELLNFCKKEPIIIYFEQFNDYDEQTAILLLELAESLLTRFLLYKTFIIFEFDIDENSNLITSFCKFPPKHTSILHFNRFSTDTLKHYFFSILGDIVISEKNLEYILNSSFGNLMYLNITINYLRGENYIRLQEGGFVCDELPAGILADVLKEFILQRYDKLDTTLKEVLAKSSMIGNVFNSELLSKPFRIINADQVLQQIENISKLIMRPDEISYTFENKDVYKLIRDSVSPQLQKEWHSVLANYYENLLKRDKQRKGLKSVYHEISRLYPTAKHFMHAQNFDIAINYFLELMSKYEILADYSHELEAIQDIQYMLEFIDLDKLHFDLIEYDMLKAKANCYRNMGDFSQACRIYKECLCYFDDEEFTEPKFELLYQLAYSLYMSGELKESLKILNPIKDYLELNEMRNNLYMKLLSLLASVYDSTGDMENQKKYYIMALNYYKDNNQELDYYILLRMASMAFGEELAIEMETAAEKFFREKHFTKYLAEVLHNKATDYLYLENLSNVLELLNESIDLFDSFGSHAVHYPLNTKGILKMVLEQDYKGAIIIFNQALQYDIEPYSEIIIRTNILNCLNLLKEPHKALEQLADIDTLIASDSAQTVPAYAIYQNLNWAFYYYHTKNYDECLKRINICAGLNYMELRFKYIYKSLKYLAKKALGVKTRNTAGTASVKVHKTCINKGFYFTTLRFYESI